MHRNLQDKLSIKLISLNDSFESVIMSGHFLLYVIIQNYCK